MQKNNQQKIKNKRIAIIGAGIAGVIIANKFSELNEVTIFDKSRGDGGRLASRRADDYNFDHGAQFFKAKSQEFKDFCQKAENDGVIGIWKARFAEIVDKQINRKWQFDIENPHYVAKPQMNNLCKYLAKDLNIFLNKKIELVDFADNKWSLTTDQNKKFDNFDYLIIAIPSSQAASLIPNNFKYFDLVSNIKMLGCFSLMLGFKKDLDLDFDAALVKGSIISWISINSSKPERPNGFSILVNSSNSWAESNLEEDLELVKQKMITALSEIINLDPQIIDHQAIHRWRYANVGLRYGQKSLFDPNLNLGICGDWLISGRVESAFLSATNLYQNINNDFNNG